MIRKDEQAITVVDVNIVNAAGDSTSLKFATWLDEDVDIEAITAHAGSLGVDVAISAAQLRVTHEPIGPKIVAAITYESNPKPVIEPDLTLGALSEIVRTQRNQDRRIDKLSASLEELVTLMRGGAIIARPVEKALIGVPGVPAYTGRELETALGLGAAPIGPVPQAVRHNERRQRAIEDEEPEPVGSPQELQTRAAAEERGFPLVTPSRARHSASEPVLTGRRDRPAVTPEMSSGRMQVIGPSAGSQIIRGAPGEAEDGGPAYVVVKPTRVGRTLTEGTLGVESE